MQKTPGDLGQLLAWARKDVERWQARNDTFQVNQEFWENEPPAKTDPTQEVVKLPDGRIVLNNVAGQLSKNPYIIENSPRKPTTKREAQKIEDALRYWERECEFRHAMGGRNPLKYDEAQMILMRGVIACRVTINPNASQDEWDYLPWRFKLVDPANLYPLLGDGQILRMTHQYQASVASLLNDPALEEAAVLLEGRDESETLTVYAQYAYNAQWDYHAVFTEEGFLKKPTPIGYMPWVYVGAAGAFYEGTPWDTGQNYVQYKALSFLDAIRQVSENMDRICSMLQTALAGEANPSIGVIGESARAEVDQVDLKPGSKWALTKADVKPIAVGPRVGDYQTLFTTYQDRLEKATVPATAFGTSRGNEPMSALMGSLLNLGAANTLTPFVRALELYRAAKYRKALELFAKFAPINQPLYIPRRQAAPTGLAGQAAPGMLGAVQGLLNPSQPAPDQELPGWDTLTPLDVQKQGVHIEVVYDTLTLQDRALLAQIILPLVREGVFSRELARSAKYLAVDDPGLENLRVVGEQVVMDPAFRSALVPVALAANGEQLMLAAWNMLMQGSLGAGGVPGQGVGAGTPPGNGVPSSVVPPGATGNPTTPGDMAAAFQQLLQRVMPAGGPAQGGAGLGGVPPAPPMTNQPIP